MPEGIANGKATAVNKPVKNPLNAAEHIIPEIVDSFPQLKILTVLNTVQPIMEIGKIPRIILP